MKRLFIPAMAVALLPSCAQTPSGSIDAALATVTEHELDAHLRFLSHDLVEGRAPGTRGGELAAHYIAAQFQAAGLQPVDGSYFQSVPLIGATPQDSGVRLGFRAGGRSTTAEYKSDFVLRTGNPESPLVEGSGELVFVGYGISAPENDWDDFKGMDMTGKVLLVLVSDPPATAEEADLFGGPAMTYYGRWTYKWEEAARQGALAALIVHTTEEAGYPWSVVRGGRTGEQIALPPDPNGPPPLPMEGWVTHETAQWVLAMAGLDFDELMAQAGQRSFQPVATGIQTTGRVANSIRRTETMNVVGLVPGSQRPDEIITITSHYDHFGIAEARNGDSIYNGSYDNASGISMIIEMGEAFASMSPRPARSILFIATAAEEFGLLGSAWYAQAPLFPLSRTVAEVNLDGANMWGETDDMIVLGAQRNELGEYVLSRAEEMALTIKPDQEPEKGFFFRSDHFPLVRAGVPALYINHGVDYRGRPEGWGQERRADYTANHYHAPSDEFSEEWVYDGMIQHATLAFLTIYDIAQGTTFPNWLEGSEFKAARDRMMQGGGG